MCKRLGAVGLKNVAIAFGEHQEIVMPNDVLPGKNR